MTATPEQLWVDGMGATRVEETPGYPHRYVLANSQEGERIEELAHDLHTVRQEAIDLRAWLKNARENCKRLEGIVQSTNGDSRDDFDKLLEDAPEHDDRFNEGYESCQVRLCDLLDTEAPARGEDDGALQYDERVAEAIRAKHEQDFAKFREHHDQTMAAAFQEALHWLCRGYHPREEGRIYDTANNGRGVSLNTWKAMRWLKVTYVDKSAELEREVARLTRELDSANDHTHDVHTSGYTECLQDIADDLGLSGKTRGALVCDIQARIRRAEASAPCDECGYCAGDLVDGRVAVGSLRKAMLHLCGELAIERADLTKCEDDDSVVCAMARHIGERLTDSVPHVLDAVAEKLGMDLGEEVTEDDIAAWVQAQYEEHVRIGEQSMAVQLREELEFEAVGGAEDTAHGLANVIRARDGHVMRKGANVLGLRLIGRRLRDDEAPHEFAQAIRVHIESNVSNTIHELCQRLDLHCDGTVGDAEMEIEKYIADQCTEFVGELMGALGVEVDPASPIPAVSAAVRAHFDDQRIGALEALSEEIVPFPIGGMSEAEDPVAHAAAFVRKHIGTERKPDAWVLMHATGPWWSQVFDHEPEEIERDGHRANAVYLVAPPVPPAAPRVGWADEAIEYAREKGPVPDHIEDCIRDIEDKPHRAVDFIKGWLESEHNCPRCKRAYRFAEEQEHRLCAKCVVDLGIHHPSARFSSKPELWIFHGDDGYDKIIWGSERPDSEDHLECECGAPRTGWLEPLFGVDSDDWERVGPPEEGGDEPETPYHDRPGADPCEECGKLHGGDCEPEECHSPGCDDEPIVGGVPKTTRWENVPAGTSPDQLRHMLREVPADDEIRGGDEGETLDQDTCLNCGDPPRKVDDNTKWTDRGDALCPECGEMRTACAYPCGADDSPSQAQKAAKELLEEGWRTEQRAKSRVATRVQHGQSLCLHVGPKIAAEMRRLQEGSK